MTPEQFVYWLSGYVSLRGHIPDADMLSVIIDKMHKCDIANLEIQPISS